MATFTQMELDGVQLPCPAHEGVKITMNPVHSENTGRSASGKAQGTVKAWKATIEVKWPPLTPGKCDLIDSAICKTKFERKLKYTDNGGNTHTKTVYVSATPGTQYSWVKGMQYITGKTAEFIEC